MKHPVGAALGFWTPLQGRGIWIGLATGLAVVAVLMTVRWSRRESIGLTRRGSVGESEPVLAAAH